MNEDNIIKRQMQILEKCRKQLDELLGKNGYPDSLLVSCHNWTNKWLMSESIQRERRERYK